VLRDKLVGKLPVTGELLHGSLLERNVRHTRVSRSPSGCGLSSSFLDCLKPSFEMGKVPKGVRRYEHGQRLWILPRF
jgi:hypothetical protein